MTKSNVKWPRSEEGYLTSKCGCYDIRPIFIGRTTPQAFQLYWVPREGPSVKLHGYLDTQRQAKAEAEKHFLKRKLEFARSIVP